MIFMISTAAVTTALILTIFFCFYKSRPTLTLYATVLFCSVSSVLALALGNLHVASITLSAFVACGLSAPMYLMKEEAQQNWPLILLALMPAGLPVILAAIAEVIIIGLLHKETRIPLVFVISVALTTALSIFAPTFIALDDVLRLRAKLFFQRTHVR
ncbi:MAG: hypothetical protein A3B74_05090 [Candidatus Kerfeldbacteria bacterium RIFCSPHIGHO2_02_FULL_42_14]|uniref:Uncharacterized protein n=1 Tax=Candidatus Kerfeldbacteria bacterium RIFCSPHIGHO2_02_FULL_42_14 TaxID=1798540 RepID=A0A1G2ATK2_9BACT|nr:MAG: hypothetical protein A3B74_05090 [Candidatus Kerfeldbacteria bacterium RIFCSPHIGHO2_02_FULL_42_14]OGY81384.1 MAG: hypothetical protein A3E60_01690 [Candidatus Kerfeldbacteria bacterium RIFCSPHIGHO2_12_FULL_42_13]OGY83228.1 MAG: hypothetical protein A3I91_03570 [Candidatus Kerfeldbacteria bacterium RIFCSPLOWO2_02_FULL_42_19]OGY85533.1 MAG: hypothetical protein A3G01_01560 [Candidatus Kerfeldbacteria bacterium RIFCSPLOWO2_12_FULL_43_9]